MPELTRTRRRGFLTALLGLTVLTLGAGVFSLAIFTDTDSSTGSFAAGSVDIVSSPTVAFTVSNMLPGDSDTQPLTITNNGFSQFRYAMSTVATNAFGSALQLTVKTVGAGCGTFNGATVLATTTLNGAAIGDPAQGADLGDRILDAGTNEVLCFRVTFPDTGNDNALQGGTSAVTFTFDAEQVANNP